LKKARQGAGRHKGYRRFLMKPDDGHFAIDRAKAEEDAKFDGVFVLRTNARLSPLEAMLVYKQLWTVERAFRTSKSLLETRPIYHKLDETIRGHVSCSFLALVLKKELEDRIAAMGEAAPCASWPEILADLDSADRDRGRTGRQAFSSCARRPAPPRAWRCAPPASPCRPPCVSSPPPDPIPPTRPQCSATALFKRRFRVCGQKLADSRCRRSVKFALTYVKSIPGEQIRY